MEKYLILNLHLFDNTNVTTDNELSVEMKTYYADFLIDNAVPKLVHDQFGQKVPIPQGKGKTVEFRKYTPLVKALTPLTEGVTPEGKKLNVTSLEATVQQYGDYIEVSDMLILTAIDNNLVQATKLLGNQAGETLDTITREVLNGGTNVQYGESSVTARYQLSGGLDTGNHYLSVKGINMGVRTLKVQKAEKIDGYYIVIAHPDTLFDLMEDKRWIHAAEYAGSEQIFEGEVGKLSGCRFVETTEAKIWHADDLVKADGTNGAVRNLTIASVAGAVVTVKEAIAQAQADDMVGRMVIIGNELNKIESVTAGAAGAAKVTLEAAPSATAADTVIYPGEAGAEGRDVYSTLMIGDNAYGVTEIQGGGLQHIVKQLGSSGTADPLNQRATVGWKATKTAERLVEQFILRIETASTFESGAN